MIITVKDSGRGIKKEDIEKLFTKFQRLEEDRNTTIEGTGLGLPITKHLLDLMDGEIAVDSIYTQGSVFSVTIPQKIVETEAMGEFKIHTIEKSEETYYSKLFEAPEARILIVDDEINNQFTEAFFNHTLIEELKTSSTNSPAWFLNP